MKLNASRIKIGVARKMAVYGFLAQAVADLMIGLAMLMGSGVIAVVGSIAGIVTVAGFVVAFCGFLMMYFIRGRKRHLTIAFLMLVYFLVNFMLLNPALIQLLLSLAYTGVMLWSAISDRKPRVAAATGAAMVLYAVSPFALGAMKLPDTVMSLFTAVISGYCAAAVAYYAYNE